MLFTALLNFLVPGGLAALAVLFLLNVDTAASWSPGARAMLPWIVWTAGAGMGVLFHRNRLVYAVAALVLAERLLAMFCDSPAAMSSGLGLTVYQATAVLLPLNLALFALLRERGILSSRSVWVIGFLLAQPAAVGMLLHFRVAPFIGLDAHPFSWGARDPFAPFPPLAYVSMGLAGVACLFAWLQRREAIESGLFWAVILCGWTFYRGTVDLVTPLLLASAGLVLVLSLINLSYRLAYRDDLTTLPARRALNEAGRKMSAGTVAMVDVDHFKKVNDRHGHDVGDQVLRMVASCLGRVRGGGRAFRYGGEEFAILFQGKNPKQVQPHLEELREDIDKAQFILRGRHRPRKKPDAPKTTRTSSRRLHITVSIGMAERVGREIPFEDAVKAADKALYRAKRGGRNCIKVSSVPKNRA